MPQKKLLRKMEWTGLIKEMCAALIAVVPAEEFAEATGLNANSISCFSYKSKGNIPNLLQFGIMLDKAFEENPQAVVQVLKKMAARYKVFADSLEALGREVARNNATGGM